MNAMKQAAAVALSGAGPSLIAFSSKREKEISASAVKAFEIAGLAARVFKLKISHRGAEVHLSV